jgi:hypothetical protein
MIIPEPFPKIVRLHLPVYKKGVSDSGGNPKWQRTFVSKGTSACLVGCEIIAGKDLIDANTLKLDWHLSGDIRHTP